MHDSGPALVKMFGIGKYLSIKSFYYIGFDVLI